MQSSVIGSDPNHSIIKPARSVNADSAKTANCNPDDTRFDVLLKTVLKLQQELEMSKLARLTRPLQIVCQDTLKEFLQAPPRLLEKWERKLMIPS